MAHVFNPWWLQSILPGFGHGLSLLNGQSHQDIQRDDRIPVIDDPFHSPQPFMMPKKIKQGLS